MCNYSRIFLLFFSALVLFSNAILAQGTSSLPERPIRIEIPAKSTDETFRVIPCGTTGMVLFFKSVETVGDSLSKWYYSLYDQNLHQSWVKSIPVASNLMIQESIFKDDTLSMLFLTSGKEKGGRFNFCIIRLALSSSNFICNMGTLPEEAEDVGFKVLHKLAFLCYNIKDEPARLQVLQLDEGKASTFPWSKGAISKVTEFTVDSVSLRVRASLLQVSSYKSRLDNFLVSMDISGKILAEIPIQPSTTNRYLRGLDFIPVEAED